MDEDLRVSAKTVLSSRIHMGNLGHGVWSAPGRAGGAGERKGERRCGVLSGSQ